MRIAFADMMFSWPPHGGGDVDMFHVLRGAAGMGHEVRLFAARDEATWERGRITEGLPFPAETLSFSGDDFTGPRVAERFRAAVDAWNPDAVFAGQGFLMKPYLLAALGDWPLVSRYHAHEAACLRDITRFLDGAPCPNAFLDTPEVCRDCSLRRWGGAIRNGETNAWLREYLGAACWKPEYAALVRDALARVRVALVSTASMAAALGGLPASVRIVPSFTDLDPFLEIPPGSVEGPLTILMPGRAEDPVKGFTVLAEAADRLWARRQDFRVAATLAPGGPERPWLEPLGWVAHDQMPDLYARAAVCAVPSVWEEPFGLVAVEAMAAGRPVVANRTGGLTRIVADGETGLLAPPGDAAALVDALARLLDDPALRARLGAAGRARALAEHAPARIQETHYRPLWDALAEGRP